MTKCETCVVCKMCNCQQRIKERTIMELEVVVNQ